ncbi:MAG: disulfide bond formation protein B [bacterium]
MVGALAKVIPYLVIISHVLLVIAFLAILSRRTWGRGIYEALAKRAVLWGFLIALVSIVGSLFYSEIIGYEACVLCWWQRVFLYPQAIIFGVALWFKDNNLFRYIVPLAIFALVIALYQEYANLGGTSLFSCTTAEGACSKIYVKEFGYITIPVMSITVSLYVLLLAWVHKLHREKP